MTKINKVRKSVEENYLRYLILNKGPIEQIGETMKNSKINDFEEKTYLKKIKKIYGYKRKINKEEKIIRDNNILNFILNYSGEYSSDEIANIFEVDTKTIRNILSLIDRTKNIKSKSRKKKIIIEGLENSIDKITNDTYGLEEIKKLYIIFIIISSFDGKVKREVFSKYFLSVEDINFFIDTENEKSKKNYLDRLIRELLNDSELVEEDGYINIPENKIAKLERNDIEELLLYISILKEVHPKKNVYKNINSKIKSLNDNKEYDFISINQNLGLSIYDEEKVELLEKALIEDKYIKFKYKAAQRREFLKNNFILPLGIIYSYHNDLWYLEALDGYGKRQEKKMYKLDNLYDVQIMEKDDLINFSIENNLIVNLNIKIGQTIYYINSVVIRGIDYDFENNTILLNYFNDGKIVSCDYDKVMDLHILNKSKRGSFKKKNYDKALNINAGREQKVKVKFENEEFIKRKLDIYIKERKNARLFYENNFILLYDNVAGITEFQAWVKSFGKSAVCLEPFQLVTNIKESLVVLKERYKENE